jgi:hypothetical protein
MKEITLKEAYEILENASAIVVDDNVLVYPGLYDITGDLKNEFLYISWENDGEEFEIKFLEGHNQTCTIAGSSLFLKDSEGEDTQISILTTKTLE